MVYFYNSPRRCGPYKIPLPIQNAYLRDYARRKNLEFSLPITEYIFPQVWSGLQGILRRSTGNDTIVMFSICCIIDVFFKGRDNLETLKLFELSNAEFIFALEGITVKARDVNIKVDEFVKYNKVRLC